MLCDFEQKGAMMSTRMELEDLPPQYRAQAEAQIAARSWGKCTSPQPMADVARTAGKLGKTFESRGEYEYYMSIIVPGIQSGKIIEATPHVAFSLLPAKEYGNVKLPAARYTADYVLKYADGTVEVVEIKSKFTRRAQRDYIYRRRLFIDLIAEPKGYKFTEIITPDSQSEVKEWKRLAEQAGRGCWK
nr:MAG TPA: Endonuclease [Caudoviricetes sp.]